MVKKHSVSDTARTASLADLRCWPGDGVFGMKPNSGSDALPTTSLPEDFSGKIGSYSEVGIPTSADSHCLRNGWRGSAGQVRRRQLSPHRTTGKIFSRLSSKPTSTFFLLGRISTLGSAGGFYAGQARPGSDAGQESNPVPRQD